MRAKGWITVAVTALLVAGALGTAAFATGASTAAKWIVFSADPNGAGVPQLFRVRTTGADIRQISKGGLPAVSPAFSPNGSRIAFSRLGSGIFSMNADGTGLRRLTSSPRDSYPVYSPNGKRIAFIRLFRNSWRVFTMTASGTSERRLPGAPPAGRASWSADSSSLFIPSAGDLVRVDATTGKVQKYYGVPLDIQTGQTATVSPNGRQTVFVNPRPSTGPPDCGEGRCQQFGLFMANLAPPHRLHKLVDDTGAAGWSGDGRTIVYAAKGVLTLRNVASGKQTAVKTGTHVVAGDAPPAWQP